ATQLSNTLENITAPYSGTIAQQNLNLTQQIQDQQSQITFLNAEIAAKTTLLQNQFATMESALASLQSQGGMLTQLANLANFNAAYATGSSSSSSSSGK